MRTLFFNQNLNTSHIGIQGEPSEQRQCGQKMSDLHFYDDMNVGGLSFMGCFCGTDLEMFDQHLGGLFCQLVQRSDFH